MLFILTGQVQIGKTRWLQALAEELQSKGVPCGGVIAPGIWVERPEGQLGTEADRGLAGEGRYEKLGINNLLLPEGRIVPFARRRDLSQADGTENAGSQSARAQLSWDISDDAIDQVNRHFDQLAASKQEAEKPGMIIVDEFGRLELMRGEGLTSAMDLLAQGPSPLAAHALIVVREGLLDLAYEVAENRFASWGKAEAVSPTEETASRIKALFSV